jgi:hypothetical protein
MTPLPSNHHNNLNKLEKGKPTSHTYQQVLGDLKES